MVKGPYLICRNGEDFSEEVLPLEWSRVKLGGFPGGSVVKNAPVNAWDTGSIPDPGISLMPQNNSARVPQLLSLCSPGEATIMSSLHVATREKPPLTTTREKPTQQARPGTAKNKSIKLFLKDYARGTCLVVQWLRFHLPEHGTRVWSLVRSWDPTCSRAAKPACHREDQRDQKKQLS